MLVLDVLWLPITAIYAIILLYFFVMSLNIAYMVVLAWTRPPRHPDPPPLRDYPYVTVQLPIYNELYVCERLIDAACRLDWPRERLEIQVLDDSTDETRFVVARLVRQRAAEGVNITHIHRTDRVGYKAGALEAGQQSARGEFIAIFDADFIPPVNFLQETIPHFFRSEVGFVQARWGHLNRSYSILTQVQAVTIDTHFFVDQVARNRGGYFMNFNGTAGVWRRATIQDAGGWQHDTLAEDLDLSYRAQLRGWEAVYLPDVVCYAELPVTVSSYRCQQRRWAAGSFACAIKLLPSLLCARVSLPVKIEGVFHLAGYASHVGLLGMFVLQPIILYYGHRFHSAPSASPGITPFWSVVATVAGFVPAAYLAYSQWRATGKPIQRFPFVMAASIMGPAIMTTTVTAMLRVLYTRKFVFERTPKYGIAGSSDSWDGKRYTLNADSILGVEILLACYGMGSIMYAASLRNWASLSFSIYVLVALSFIIGVSLVQMSVPMRPHILASASSGNRES